MSLRIINQKINNHETIKIFNQINRIPNMLSYFNHRTLLHCDNIRRLFLTPGGDFRPSRFGDFRI